MWFLVLRALWRVQADQGAWNQLCATREAVPSERVPNSQDAAVLFTWS